MIWEEKARFEAIDFLDSENLPKLSQMFVKGYCLSKVFPEAVRSLGKKRILVLYRKLSLKLKRYFLANCISGDTIFNNKLWEIDNEYNFRLSSRHFQALQKALVKYLGK